MPHRRLKLILRFYCLVLDHCSRAAAHIVAIRLPGPVKRQLLHCLLILCFSNLTPENGSRSGRRPVAPHGHPSMWWSTATLDWSWLDLVFKSEWAGLSFFFHDAFYAPPTPPPPTTITTRPRDRAWRTTRDRRSPGRPLRLISSEAGFGLVSMGLATRPALGQLRT